MADEPFSDTAESKSDEEVPEGQALVSWHLLAVKVNSSWLFEDLPCEWTSVKIGHDHGTILLGQRVTGCPADENSRHVKF